MSGVGAVSGHDGPHRVLIRPAGFFAARPFRGWRDRRDNACSQSPVTQQVDIGWHAIGATSNSKRQRPLFLSCAVQRFKLQRRDAPDGVVEPFVHRDRPIDRARVRRRVTPTLLRSRT